MKIQPPKGCRHRAGDFNVREHTHTLEKTMKIKSNVRAGAGGGNSNSKAAAGGHSSQANNTVVFYVPPVSRCVGI